MGRGKQIVILLLILILGVGCIYLGIQIKNRPEPQEEESVKLGSYQEIGISLPVLNEGKGEEYLHLMRGMDGSVELFTVLYNEDKTLVRGYKKYKLNAESKWDEADADWMALEFFSDTNYVIRLMSYAETGSLYLVLHNLTAEVPESDEVVRVSTEGEVEHVGVKGLYKTTEDGVPIQIVHMFIANNNICITDEHSAYYAYSLVTGELYGLGSSQASYALASDGTNLYTMNDWCNAVYSHPFESLPNMSLSSITAFGSTFSNASQIAPKVPRLWNRTTLWEEKESEYEFIDYRLLYSGDTLYLSCQDGIYSLPSEADSWQMLMPGIDCVFGRPSVVQQDFIESNESFYVYSKDFTGKHYLTQYSRQLAENEDEEDERTVLTVTSYRRRAVITEAVVAFQQANPNVKVVYEVALDKNPDLSIEEYQSQIQSALQSGSAPDILVCDELDYMSYMENGYFENISDLMKPMYTSANLYGNVTNAMAQTKIFVTPAKFQSYFSYGADSLITSMNELAELSAWSEKQGKKAFSGFSLEQLTDLFCSFYQENYCVDGTLDAAQLAQALTSFQTVASVASGDVAAPEDWYALPVSAEALETPGITLIDSAKAFSDMLAVLNASDISWSNACGRFQPESIVGISSQSSNVKLAKEFIRMLYSETVQLQDVGPGIPMSKDAVAAWSTQNIADTDVELLATELQALDYCYAENSELRAAVYQVLELFFAGELTAEDAAKQIISYEPAVSTYAPFEPEEAAIKVLFVGDAFTADSGLVSTFQALAALRYPEITVNPCVHSQESLKEQLKYMEGDEYQTYSRIRNADVIILQEKPGSASTVQAVSRALSYCKEGARVYYLLTEKELDTDILERLSIFEELTIIPVGALAAQLTDDGPTGITLTHLNTDGRTNALYGYLTALTTYQAVFGELPEHPDAIALTAEATSDLLALVPGAGDVGKQSSLTMLPDIVQRYCEEYYK